ncbi:hypothetical protein [Winogradskyella sp. PG-2]|nr:hypothetical protein [Winogradskyella sp. PG-2]BAO74431.1 hypothetical protein WPG_0201 [Winogradskyella sp. PG-2]
MYKVTLIIIFIIIVVFCYYNRHLFDFDDDTDGPDEGDFFDD